MKSVLGSATFFHIYTPILRMGRGKTHHQQPTRPYQLPSPLAGEGLGERGRK
ncbi:MAG: hypothetical protein ABW170_18195 [Candidatus Thiodiazotropha sp. L084R]